MNTFLTIFLAVSLFVVGLSFMSPCSTGLKNNASDNYIQKVRYEDYGVQYKHRNIIREKREEKLKELKDRRDERKKPARSFNDDFIAFGDSDSTRIRYEDFR